MLLLHKHLSGKFLQHKKTAQNESQTCRSTSLPYIIYQEPKLLTTKTHSYPETAGKTLEEIELLFAKDGPHPWNTKPGNSLLDARVQDIQEHGGKVGAAFGGGAEVETAEDVEKTATGAPPQAVETIA